MLTLWVNRRGTFHQLKFFVKALPLCAESVPSVHPALDGYLVHVKGKSEAVTCNASHITHLCINNHKILMPNFGIGDFDISTSLIFNSTHIYLRWIKHMYSFGTITHTLRLSHEKWIWALTSKTSSIHTSAVTHRMTLSCNRKLLLWLTHLEYLQPKTIHLLFLSISFVIYVFLLYFSCTSIHHLDQPIIFFFLQ